ncbi:MAG: inositol monophosphatase family protein [bacterium]|nr:inositol monophosphatase family protein [bacterium]
MIEKKDWRSLLEPIMRKAGAIILGYGDKELKTAYKNNQGLVTEADRASENYLIEALSKILPEAAIVAEESGNNGSGNYCWVIDPLDGTTNFVHELPYFCISVALTYNNEPVVGAIFNPLRNEFFYAQRGHGATLNGKPIHVSSLRAVGKSLIALGLPYDHELRAPLLDVANKLAQKAFGIRHIGAAALDLAYVACGRFEGCFFSHLAWWDVAAGVVLIQEAGGTITDFYGKPLTPEYISCMAGGPAVYQELKNMLDIAVF